MIPIKILEKELDETYKKCELQNSEIIAYEDRICIVKQDLAFNTTRAVELKEAIEKLKATEL